VVVRSLRGRRRALVGVRSLRTRRRALVCALVVERSFVRSSCARCALVVERSSSPRATRAAALSLGSASWWRVG